MVVNVGWPHYYSDYYSWLFYQPINSISIIIALVILTYKFSFMSS